MSALLISYLQAIITPLHAVTEQLGITKKTKTTTLEYHRRGLPMYAARKLRNKKQYRL